MSSNDTIPIPSPAKIALRLKDQQLLKLVADNVPLSEVAQVMGYPSAKKAREEIVKALGRVDKLLIDSRDALRVREFMRMERMTEALEQSDAGMSDPKVAAELRLQSGERRKMYDLDIQRDEAVPDVQVHVMFETPDRRGAADDVIDGTVVPEQIESGEGGS